eukprot:scaffold278030_cov21-Tisochrysis_lutea.AAC.1
MSTPGWETRLASEQQLLCSAQHWGLNGQNACLHIVLLSKLHAEASSRLTRVYQSTASRTPPCLFSYTPFLVPAFRLTPAPGHGIK